MLLRFSLCTLLLDNFEDFHGAGLDTNTTGDALGSNGRILGLDQNMERANILALATANTELLVDHVNALGVLGNGAMLTDSGAFAALHANHWLGLALKIHNLDAGLILMEFLVERIGTCTHTFQTGHAFCALLNRQLFHINTPLISLYVVTSYDYTTSFNGNQSTRCFYYRFNYFPA